MRDGLSEIGIKLVTIAILLVTFWLGKTCGRYEYISKQNALQEIVQLQRKIDVMESAVRILKRLDNKQREGAE